MSTKPMVGIARRLPAKRPSPPLATAPAMAAMSDLLSMADLGVQGMRAVLELAAMVKACPGEFSQALAGKQIVMIFEKPSLRTRITFESGMAAMGGTALFIDQRDVRLGVREPLCDVARNLERWVHGIVLRTFAHETVTDMAHWAAIPVINGLSDYEHPCQALADYLTLEEKLGDLKKVKLAYVGDGNNMAHSLLLASAYSGGAISVATPAGYEPNAKLLEQARRIARTTGATIECLHDARVAVAGAHAVYTDVWASMGQEDEAAARKAIFAGYQVNDELMAHAASNALFMHCLPAHRGDEVTAKVIESSRSVVFDQAENRLHVQKAILLMLLAGESLRLPARSAHA